VALYQVSYTFAFIFHLFVDTSLSTPKQWLQLYESTAIRRCSTVDVESRVERRRIEVESYIVVTVVTITCSAYNDYKTTTGQLQCDCLQLSSDSIRSTEVAEAHYFQRINRKCHSIIIIELQSQNCSLTNSLTCSFIAQSQRVAVESQS